MSEASTTESAAAAGTTPNAPAPASAPSNTPEDTPSTKSVDTAAVPSTEAAEAPTAPTPTAKPDAPAPAPAADAEPATQEGGSSSEPSGSGAGEASQADETPPEASEPTAAEKPDSKAAAAEGADDKPSDAPEPSAQPAGDGAGGGASESGGTSEGNESGGASETEKDSSDAAADSEVSGAAGAPREGAPDRRMLSGAAGRRRSSTPTGAGTEHGFSRRAEVERIPSRTAQPSEQDGGMRLWVTKAAERPPSAVRALAGLKAAEDADDAVAAAKEEGKSKEEVAKLEEIASKARSAAVDPDTIDWDSEAYAPYSLDEQIQAVQRATHELSRPAVSAEGWLKRIKTKAKTAKSRYFVLTPKALVYFAQASHAKVSPSGYLLAEWDFPALPSRLSLRSHGARVWLKDITGIRTSVEDKTLTLSRPEEKGGDIVLEAASADDCMGWSDAIEESRMPDDEGDVDEDSEDDEKADDAAEEDDDAKDKAAGDEEGGSSSSSSSAGATGARTRRPTLLGRMFGGGGGGDKGADAAAGGEDKDKDKAKDEDKDKEDDKDDDKDKDKEGEDESGPPGQRTRRGTLLGRMFGRGPLDEKAEAERKAKAEKAEAERKAKAEEAAKVRKAKAEEAAKVRKAKAEEAAKVRKAKAEERKAKADEASRQRTVDRKKAAILAKQHREEEEKKRAEMSLEAILKLKAETEAKHRPVFWQGPKLSKDASAEEIDMTPTLHTVVQDRFRSYLEDRDGNPVALMRGWLSKDAESTVSMGVPKTRYFVLTPYFLAYFCSESDAQVTAKGYMAGRAMGDKPRRLMRLGARIGLDHIVDITENKEFDETDDVLGDLDSGAALAAERGDVEAAEALAREAKERKRAIQLEASGGAEASPGEGGGGASSGAGGARKAGKGRAPRRSMGNGMGMMAATSAAGASSSSSSSAAAADADGSGRIKRGSSFAGSRLRDGRCVTPPKPRSKPPPPDVPPPGLATKIMMKKARARLGTDPSIDQVMPRVESATLSIDLGDRTIRLQCHKVAYRDEWARMLRVWKDWWRKRQEQITLEQWSAAAAFRHSQATMSMSRDEARKKRGGAGGKRTGGRRYVSGRGKGLPSK